MHIRFKQLPQRNEKKNLIKCVQNNSIQTKQQTNMCTVKEHLYIIRK